MSNFETLASKIKITPNIKCVICPFSNIVLVTLFKFFGNTCGWKSVVKIHVVLFK